MINKLLFVTLSIMSVMIVLLLTIYLVPWYTQELPYKIYGDVFKPGQEVTVEVRRNALIDLKGHIVLELVRIEKEISYEVSKSSFYINIDRGKKTIIVYYSLPTLKSCPSLKQGFYSWKGHITYKPFGLIERRFHFVTEKFQIILGVSK